jgi:hypothetical protein
MSHLPILLAAAVALMASASASAVESANNSDRIAVLVTDWAEPEGFDPTYRKAVVERSFGARAETPNDPCDAGFVGEGAYRVQMGLIRYAVVFKTKGLEGAHDAMGLYRLSADGQSYVSIYDPSVVIAVRDVPPLAGLITPARDMRKPVSRSLWAVDPRDGRDYLDGVVQIGRSPEGPKPNPLAFPNGIRDADEYSWAAAITDFSILHEDLTPHLSVATTTVHETTKRTLAELYGDRIEVQFGAYAPFPPHTRVEDDVALDFARRGFARMVLARETTDNNNYANNFMTRGYVERALCKAGFKNKVAFQQARQVGRTPEYNLVLLHIAKKNLDNIAHGSEVAVLYTTYGLPFPGRAGPGPFAAPHPWSKEVYHENAYNNYVSFKRYLEAYFGDRYRFAWNPKGLSGDKRADNYYSYGIFTPADSAVADSALRFRTLRENIDRAKQDGRKQILAVLSHWYHNGRDPLLAVRVMQKIPLQTRDEIRRGQFWKSWCERVESSDPVPCNDADSSIVRLHYTETFDSWAKEFGIGYAQHIRGALERFGAMPATLDIKVLARGRIDREGGGTVAVVAGPNRGARLTIAADAHPGAPESFTLKDYRVFNDPADNLVSAWDDFDAYIGTQRVPQDRLAAHGRRVSETLLFGPYRTLVNRPATIALPVNRKPLKGERLEAFVYNEVSEHWEPVFAPAGGNPLRYDAKARLATFDTQVLGVFAVVAVGRDWNPRRAIVNPRRDDAVGPAARLKTDPDAAPFRAERNS